MPEPDQPEHQHEQEHEQEHDAIGEAWSASAPDGQELLARVRAADVSVRRTIRAAFWLWVTTILMATLGTLGTKGRSASQGPVPMVLSLVLISSVVPFVLSLVWTYLIARRVGRRELIFKGLDVASLPTPEPEFGESFGPLRVIGVDDESLHLAYGTPSGVLIARRFFVALGLLIGMGLVLYRSVTSFRASSIKFLVFAPIALVRYFKPIALQFMVGGEGPGESVLTIETLRLFFFRRLLEVPGSEGVELFHRSGALVANIPGAMGAGGLRSKPEEVRLVGLGNGKSAQWQSRRLGVAILARLGAGDG